jgi:hypothetical protein
MERKGCGHSFMKGTQNMTRVEELEMAVDSLTPKEYNRFRRWFLDRDWEKWDQEIEEDAEAGRLDFLVREAAEAKSGRRLKDL